MIFQHYIWPNRDRLVELKQHCVRATKQKLIKNSSNNQTTKSKKSVKK